MQVPASFLDGSVDAAAQFLAETEVAARRAGGLHKCAAGVADQVMNYLQSLSPEARNALIGAGVGGVGGGALGMMSKRRGRTLPAAITGALSGAALGGFGTLAANNVPSTAPPPEQTAKQIEGADDFHFSKDPVGGVGKVLSGIGNVLTGNPVGDPNVPHTNGWGLTKATGGTAFGGVGGYQAVNALMNAGGRSNPIVAERAGHNLRTHLAGTDPGKQLGKLDELFNPQTRAIAKPVPPTPAGAPRPTPTGAPPPNLDVAALTDINKQLARHPGMVSNIGIGRDVLGRSNLSPEAKRLLSAPGAGRARTWGRRGAYGLGTFLGMFGGDQAQRLLPGGAYVPQGAP